MTPQPLTPAPARPRADAAAITALARRLTVRDHQILDAVHHHRVLTTPQLAAMFFDNPHTAARRLAILHQHRALLRTRVETWPGSGPYHYVLDTLGAHVLAADRGVSINALRYRREEAAAQLLSAKLRHTVGVNNIAAALTFTDRHTAAARLITWWPEHRCAQAWKGQIHPDAYGRWSEHGQRVEFFLEHDTGTEPLTRVAAKLDAYLRLADATGLTTPLLFTLPSPTREANLRALIWHTTLPVATTSGLPGTRAVPYDLPDPAGPIWLPLRRTRRTRLADLANIWPLDADPQAAA